MSHILIIYSSINGHTLKICRTLQTSIEGEGHQVMLAAIEDSEQIDLRTFDKIIIGSSVHYGYHHPKIHRFIERNQQLLGSEPNAFFSVSLAARKTEKCSPETNPYLRKFLKRIDWKPKALAVFAGKLDYPSYQPVDRLLIRLIMWITKGPTDPESVIEFTDWAKVKDFAHVICKM